MRTLLSRLWDHGTTILCAVTLIALVLFPLPFCIDCEMPNPWGHVAVWEEGPVTVWFFIAPLLAGLLALRGGWLVPVWVVFTLLATQRLGGVVWWSLRDDEGPFILLFGPPRPRYASQSGT